MPSDMDKDDPDTMTGLLIGGLFVGLVALSIIAAVYHVIKEAKEKSKLDRQNLSSLNFYQYDRRTFINSHPLKEKTLPLNISRTLT